MPIYEALASLYAIKHVMRDNKRFGLRHVILTDSMTAAVSYDKGRSQSFRLRRVLQQSGALCLATGSSFRLRWVPSEWNPADGPSRGGFSATLPTRRFGDDPPSIGGGDNMGEKCEATKEPTCQGQFGPATNGSTVDLGHRARDRAQSGEEVAEILKESSGFEEEPCQGSEKLFSGRTDPYKIPEAVERFQNLGCNSQATSGEVFSTGCSSGRLCAKSVSGRRRSQCRKLPGSSNCVCESTGERGKWAPNDSTSSERLEEGMPSSEPHANSFRGSVPSGSTCCSKSDAGGWPCLALSLSALLAPWRSLQTQSSGCGQASQESRKVVLLLQHLTSPYRDGRTIEDKPMGRDALFGSTISSFLRSSSGQCGEVGLQKQATASFQRHFRRSESVPQGALGSFGLDTFGAASHVSSETWGSLIRSRSEVAQPGRNPTEGQVAVTEERQELREGQPASPVVRKSQQEGAERGYGRKKRSQPTFPVQALNGVVLQFSVFLEIFCGSGRLGRSVDRATGWPVLLWDITFGADYDLTKRCNQQKIIYWITSGKVRGGHLGTPCSSLSRARDQPGGPPPLRSDLQPLGLSGLKPHDAEKVRVGNVLARFSVRVLFLALQLCIPFTVENPQRSRLWILPFSCAFYGGVVSKFKMWSFALLAHTGRRAPDFLGFTSV